MKQFSISVLIPNYNGRKLLEAYLPSLYLALEPVNDFEVIISDDASKDDSVSFIEENYPKIILVKNKINRGFSPNVNAALAKATKELVFLLNTDVALTPEYFLKQFRYFEKEDTFGVQSLILNMKDGQPQDGGKYPDRPYLKVDANLRYFIDNPPENCWLPTYYLIGSNVLMDRIKLLTLGGFDECYAPFYGEDVDISFKAWRMGWKCYFDPFSVCSHEYSSSINTHSKKLKIRSIAYKNKFVFHHIHFDGWRLAWWYANLIFNLIIRIFLLKITFYKGFFLFLKQFPQVNRSKSQLRSLLKTSNTRLSILQFEKYIKDQLKGYSINIIR